jgi:hypothetical protein
MYIKNQKKMVESGKLNCKGNNKKRICCGEDDISILPERDLIFFSQYLHFFGFALRELKQVMGRCDNCVECNNDNKKNVEIDMKVKKEQ